jgi:histidine triad (HIT) family protein
MATNIGPDEQDCIFCKIVRGEIPSAKVLETADALAFLDIRPVNKGHVLLVPKAHHADLTELPDALAASVASLLPRLCRAVSQATHADGFNLIVNNGEVAGQTIFHGHWHVIPRRHGDPVHWPWPHSEYIGEELAQMRDAIEHTLSASANS